MRKHLKSVLFTTTVFVVVAIGVGLLYPWIQAHRWERQITSSESFDDVHQLLSKLVTSDNVAAKKVLERLSRENDRSAYDRPHNVLCCIDAEVGTTHLFTSSYSTHRCDPLTRYRDVHIVESICEAVTFAMSDEDTGKVSLLVVAYKHSGDICSLSDEEFAAWQKEGFWNTYIQRHGDPVDDQRKNKTWTPQDEKAYAQWREN
ncbi:hypothetical protein [Aporhodopirellula aestuarii]|uniref:Uncharacterized protein n=1 Tax=Aporhodopirellula aestuarii TaxID=2950107 RepID=A0ABT0U5Y0_9BACT|nr:hypothetical protein [Aporhodopirellula aestuarii]MCM2372343.1 hypothetical protein [Aporhodopirellula aestuarii]